MFKRFHVTYNLVSMSALVLLLALMSGCAREATTEIPITTTSEEARATYIEARQLAENLRLDESRAMYEQAIEQDSAFALAHWARALLGVSNREFREYLDQAVALAPNVSRGERLLIEANEALAEDKPTTALRLRKQLVRRYPNDKRAHNTLGGSYFGLDEVDQAITAYERAVELDANYPPPYNTLGYLYMNDFQFDKAENAFHNYIRLIPNEANVYDSMADLYTRMGRYEDAIENYRMSIERNPTFAFSQRKIGINQVYMGQYDAGRASMREAIGIEETPIGRVIDLEMIAFTNLYEKNPDATLASLQEALSMAEEEGLVVRIALIHSGLCRLHFSTTGDLDQAEAELQTFQEIVQESKITEGARDFFSELALGQAAQIAARRGDFDLAFAKAEELEASIAAGENPTETEGYHQNMGQIYLKQGDFSKALEHFAQANEDDPYTYYLMAKAETGAGNDERAMELYQKVVDWNEVISHNAGNHHRALGYAMARPKALAALEE